ncbi:MAG: AAA family ATPase [Prevotella sp.]|jgi:predicted AAA+ superfamily ATPase|nr:AAA family ATPase [Prevotella sp.]
MKRQFEEYLKKWKDSKDRKPLLLRGARQVGKTYLLKQFAQENFEHIVYVSFDDDRYLDDTLSVTLNPDHILDAVEKQTHIPIIEGKTIVIFDEIQENSRALTSLKYFNENKPGLHIVASGSALGVLQHKGFSFPVGKVDTQYLKPLSFLEFVNSIEGEDYTNILSDVDAMPRFRTKLEELLKLYFYVGGMPEVVRNFIENKNYKLVKTLQKRILDDYFADFSKYTGTHFNAKLQAIWNSIPKQTARENKKFKYSEVKKGSRADDYLAHIQWLQNSALIYKTVATYTPKIPLKFYEETTIFKIFICDVGLFGAMMNVHSRTILEGNALFTEYKGALAEQYICQQLFNSNDSIFYWTTEKSTNEIDFLMEAWNTSVPVEVKSGFNTQAKSLKVFREKYQPKLSFRLSLNDYNKSDDLIDLPLYAAHLIPQIIEAYNKNELSALNNK